MNNMHFTEFGTVCLGTDEITTKEFFKNMEEELDKTSYNIDHHENGDISVRYDGRDYKLDLSDDEINNPSKYPHLSKLFSLGRIETKTDLTKYNKDNLNTELTIKDKKKMISILKKKKSKKSLDNLVEYFEDLGEDLADTFDEFYYNDILEINGYISACLGVPALIIVGVLVLEQEIAPIWLLTILSGVGISAVIDVGYFFFKYIPSRFETIRDYFVCGDDDKKVYKTKIKELKKSILKDILAKFKFKKKNKDIVDMELVSNEGGVETYAPVMDQEEKDGIKITTPIPTMFEKDINLIKKIDPLFIGNIREEFQSLMSKYSDIVSSQNLSDAEIFPMIKDELIGLEFKIQTAVKMNSKRYYETQSLMDELDSIEKYQPVEEPSTLDDGPKKRERKPFKNTSKN